MEAEQKVEPKKVQILKIEKLGNLFNDINDGKTISSLVAIKDENQPLVHLVAVPSHLMPILVNGMRFCGMKTKFIEVIGDDFGEQAT